MVLIRWFVSASKIWTMVRSTGESSTFMTYDPGDRTVPSRGDRLIDGNLCLLVRLIGLQSRDQRAAHETYRQGSERGNIVFHNLTPSEGVSLCLFVRHRRGDSYSANIAFCMES